MTDGSGVDSLALANVGVADPLVVVDKLLDGLEDVVGKGHGLVGDSGGHVD
jgi:hypothetical protein